MKNTKDLAIGGQAIIEGVMMRNDCTIGTAVRNAEKKIITEKSTFKPFVKRFKFLNLPIVRGFFNLIEMMYIGTKNLIYSAEIAMEEETEKAGKLEMFITLLTSLSISILIFVVIPAFVFSQLKAYIDSTITLNIMEGIVRLGIFLGFILFTLFFKDMKRVYQYHGAEHKVVNAYEAGEEMKVGNVGKYSRIHPRCGTSFILVVMLISIVVFTFLGQPDFIHRVLYKLMLIPLISGISYEIIKLNSKYNLSLFKIFLVPGLLLQKITTREPDKSQLEVALASLEQVL